MKKKTKNAPKLKEKQSLFFRIALIALLIWCSVSLLQLRVEISELRTKVEDQAALNEQGKADNEKREEDLKNEDNLELYAYDKGYIRPGETIYKEVN